MSINFDAWRVPDWDDDRDDDSARREVEAKRATIAEAYDAKLAVLRGVGKARSGVEVEVDARGVLTAVRIPRAASGQPAALERDILACSREAIADSRKKLSLLAYRAGNLLKELSPQDAVAVQAANDVVGLPPPGEIPDEEDWEPPKSWLV